MPILFALPLIFRQTFGATLAPFVAAEERLAADRAGQFVLLGLMQSTVQLAMFLASKALQVFNLIVRLVEVNVMYVVIGRNFAIEKLPNVAMKAGVNTNEVTALNAVIIDAVKALVSVVDNLNSHENHSLQNDCRADRIT